MTQILNGVRILEVAEHTFVPAASALLADWGAEVVKIEHVERGDAMRGLASTGVAAITGDVHPLLEHSNRGKRSLALDLTRARSCPTTPTSSARWPGTGRWCRGWSRRCCGSRRPHRSRPGTWPGTSSTTAGPCPRGA